MLLNSPGIVKGYIEAKFGKFSDDSDKFLGIPIRSIPLTWSNIPEGTESLALVMQDYDAIPVCGFSWIHWTVANIDPKRNELPENASRVDVTLVQGTNSLSSKKICGDLPETVTQYYGGPRPSDQDHEYEIKLYALDTKLNLAPGFRLNELIKAMRGHTLDSAVIYGVYGA